MTDLGFPPLSILKRSALETGTQPVDFGVMNRVRRSFKLPWQPKPFQAEAVELYGWRQRAGYYAEVGTGKTGMSTFAAMFQRLERGNKVIVVGPPILCRQWARWLRQFTRLSVLIYAGTVAKRKALQPTNYSVVVMSIQMFKMDFERLYAEYEPFAVTMIVDEATSVKNISSQNHKLVRKFNLRGHRNLHECNDRSLMLLTGTPLTSPEDAYGYTKLVSGVYQNQTIFEQMHIAERDHFGQVKEYAQLELLQQNFLLNSFRVLKEDANPQMPAEVYDPIFYDLGDAHWKLYHKIATEQLLLLEDGRKIDATTPQRLLHTLQQVILSPEEYCDIGKAPAVACLQLIDEVLEELGDRKLLIFANYQRSIATLLTHLAKHGAVAVNGQVSDSKQQANIETFKSDPKCRVLILQPVSGGYGVDGLQDVCSDAFFAELPVTPRDFHQSVGRLKRTGQKNSVHVRIATAASTLQVRLQERFLQKDELVNVVQLSYQDLRAAIFGE